MESPPVKSVVISAVIAVIGHGMLWMAFWGGMILLVPKLERTFRDFDMKVPRLTENVMEVSHLVGTYFYLLPLVMLPFFALDGGIYVICRRLPRGRALAA